MQIGKVIRKYRKEKQLTQEEMAKRLGVTTPAVNKWENENSYPDITMLAPIARLLDISLDTLLGFREELTEDEIRNMIKEADAHLKKESFEKAFVWVKSRMEMYPNCLQLIWQLAVMLDAHRLFGDTNEPGKYDAFILDCYVRVLESEDEKLRTSAADSLFGYYLRKEDYESAEKYLQYLSLQNPESRRKQAQIYSKTDRIPEAYKAYEELLFSGYQMISMVFQGLYVLVMQEHDMEKARYYVDKQRRLAELFEMGKYHEASCGLDLAAAEKDEDEVLRIREQMLQSLDELTGFTEAPLYRHMTFKKLDPAFTEDLREKLLQYFQDEETFGFLKH